MDKFFIKLNLITDVQQFAMAATQMPYAIDLCSGRYIIDGKSLMGIFSLDFSQKIEVVAHTNDASALKAAVGQYIID